MSLNIPEFDLFPAAHSADGCKAPVDPLLYACRAFLLMWINTHLVHGPQTKTHFCVTKFSTIILYFWNLEPNEAVHFFLVPWVPGWCAMTCHQYRLASLQDSAHDSLRSLNLGLARAIPPCYSWSFGNGHLRDKLGSSHWLQWITAHDLRSKKKVPAMIYNVWSWSMWSCALISFALMILHSMLVSSIL